MEIVLSLAEKREAVAEAQRLYAEALAYDQSPYTGYCFHGTYVGGCGIDWMCGYCESSELGSSHYDYLKGSFRYSVALGKTKAESSKRRVISWFSEKLAEGFSAVHARDEAEKLFSHAELWLARNFITEIVLAEFRATH